MDTINDVDNVGNGKLSDGHDHDYDGMRHGDGEGPSANGSVSSKVSMHGLNGSSGSIYDFLAKEVNDLGAIEKLSAKSDHGYEEMRCRSNTETDANVGLSSKVSARGQSGSSGNVYDLPT